MIVENKNLFKDGSAACNLSVIFHGYVVTDETWHQVPLPVPWTRVYYVMDGSAFFVCEDGEVEMEPGYVYVAPCGLTYGYRGAPSVEKLFFHVNATLPNGQDIFSARDARIIRFKRSPEEMRRLLALYRSDSPANQISVNAEIWRTVAEAAVELLKPEDHKITYSANVNAAISYIRDHLSARLKASEVAEALFCSVGSLGEHFRKEIGMSVARYIDDLLMFEARRMLVSEPEKSIGEISSELGFCDQFYFSRRFVKRFSVTPRDYRRLRGES